MLVLWRQFFGCFAVPVFIHTLISCSYFALSIHTKIFICLLFVFLHFALIFLFLYPNNLYTFSSKLLILASCHVLKAFTGSGVVYIISHDLQRFKLLVSYKRRTCRKFKGFSRDRSSVKEAFKAALHLLNGKRCTPQQIFTHSGWEIFSFQKMGVFNSTS